MTIMRALATAHQTKRHTLTYAKFEKIGWERL